MGGKRHHAGTGLDLGKCHGRYRAEVLFRVSTDNRGNSFCRACGGYLQNSSGRQWALPSWVTGLPANIVFISALLVSDALDDTGWAAARGCRAGFRHVAVGDRWAPRAAGAGRTFCRSRKRADIRLNRVTGDVLPLRLARAGKTCGCLGARWPSSVPHQCGACH